jgi:hypothetical protein
MEAGQIRHVDGDIQVLSSWLKESILGKHALGGVPAAGDGG